MGEMNNKECQEEKTRKNPVQPVQQSSNKLLFFDRKRTFTPPY
jgi:hypothetical protein